jgi:hypothetical protein
MTIEKIKLTKKAISSIISWSSSRYNVMKKKEVVAEILEAMLEGGLWRLQWKEYAPQGHKLRDVAPLNGKERVEYLVTKMVYSSGSYCECRGKSSLAGYGDYNVDFEAKTIMDEFKKTTYHVEA